MTLQLEILSPSRTVLQTECQWVQLPGALGELTVLPSHIPMLAQLGKGMIHVRQAQGGDVEPARVAIAGGVAWVEQDHVRILCDDDA
ncbi:MAG: ATP synthase F1 subunit epsilon [Myxococcota bacterium]